MDFNFTTEYDNVDYFIEIDNYKKPTKDEPSSLSEATYSAWLITVGIESFKIGDEVEIGNGLNEHISSIVFQKALEKINAFELSEKVYGMQLRRMIQIQRELS